MDPKLKPILLCADSQLLFWRDGDTLFLDRIRGYLDTKTPKAAYLGAANGDNPQFYSLFVAAMEGICVTDCRHIEAQCDADDQAFLAQADIILLAGGDPKLGWDSFKEHKVNEVLLKRYYEGALLIGISAGAMQLGLASWNKEPSDEDLFDTLTLVPYLIDVHQEKTHWRHLKFATYLRRTYAKGIGIPTGGGLIYHPDQTVEPVRHPLDQFVYLDEEWKHNILMPSAESSAEPQLEALEPPQAEVIPAARNTELDTADYGDISEAEIVETSPLETNSDTNAETEEPTNVSQDEKLQHIKESHYVFPEDKKPTLH